MTSFKAGDIIVVAYPHVETRRITRRPALVISNGAVGPNGLVLWALMITSAVNKGWPGDIDIADLSAAGLPAPSVIRTEKISTIEIAGARKIGKIDAPLLTKVRGAMQGLLSI